MLFNSLSYIIFLPIVFAAYWAIPHKYRKYLLLIVSYYFYMSWNVKYVVLILFTTIVSYAAGLALEKGGHIKKRRIIVLFAISICLIVLFVFKYLNFAIESINEIINVIALPMNLSTINIILPVGISFYTFQTMSYVIDVYRGDAQAEHDFIIYATFISFFPQLVAGPIERTNRLLPQIKAEHYFDEKNALDGAKQMLVGYFKKLVIADNLSLYVDSAYADLSSYTGFDFVIIILFFTMQIYCDFSGYSDIAIGTAKLLDINLMTNFKSPYYASSVKEFWNRWHISLSSWFRDYVYIPLGGNRCSKLRHYINLMITFLVSGLWHGANWTFVIWGGIHGIALIFENVFDKLLKVIKRNKIGNIICMLIVFIFCNVAWVFFRAETFTDAIHVIVGSLYGMQNCESYFHYSIIQKEQLKEIIVYFIILATYDYISYRNLNNKISPIIKRVFYFLLALMILFCSQKGVITEFVYFQF